MPSIYVQVQLNNQYALAIYRPTPLEEATIGWILKLTKQQMLWAPIHSRSAPAHLYHSFGLPHGNHNPNSPGQNSADLVDRQSCENKSVSSYRTIPFMCPINLYRGPKPETRPYCFKPGKLVLAASTYSASEQFDTPSPLFGQVCSTLYTSSSTTSHHLDSLTHAM